VLTYKGELCDARYSKCCGGTTELFSTCWEDRDYPYLQSVPDTPEDGGRPFCDTDDEEILRKVLNDYDLKTRDFYRWTVRYSREELSRLISAACTDAGIGTVRELNALKRGPSGRISELEIVGDKGRTVIGKELAIRRALSESHLKSSAFEVEWKGDECILHGRGWGHGVGLCQIGAAVMASKGYDCGSILRHYYPGTEISELKSDE
jgi:SpoIID/LytB domain protein